MTAQPTVEPAHPETAPDRGFRELLDGFRRRFEPRLAAWLESKGRQWSAEVPETAELTGRLGPYVLRGGKRLRPAVLWFAWRGCGGREAESVLPACLSVELLHTYLLIHDDIMDRAETRRGEPAAHAVFREEHRARGWAGDAAHHGISVAILLGDLAQSAAVELFGACRGTPEALARARGAFDRMCQEVITGQYLELTAPQREGLSEEDLLQVLRMKSGRYSVERPLEIGALLAGAGEDRLAPLRRFGGALGEAFQLQDDLLGMFGDRAAVGKPVGGDLVEGKRTLLVHHGLERAPAAERARIEAALGRPDLPAEEIEAVCAILRAVGAEERVRTMIRQRLEAARRELAGLDLGSEGASFFAGLARYLEERDR